MAWELDKRDRSFQYGRLLAIMERGEMDYYSKTQETRQTNAIKFMSEYRQRPWFVFERVNRQLHQAYLNRIEPWQASRYERLTGEVTAILGEFPEEELMNCNVTHSIRKKKLMIRKRRIKPWRH